MMTHGFRCPHPIGHHGPLRLAGLLFLAGSIGGLSSRAQTLPGVTWTTATQKLVTGTSPQSIAMGDFNGDGIADIAVGQAGSIGIFLGNGDGTFKAADTGNNGVTISVPLTAPLAIASGAFQTGKPVGIVAVSGSYNAVILSNGGGGETAPAAFTGVVSATSVAAGDFNGDGKADLVVAGFAPDSSNPIVAIFLNGGGGTFGTPTLIPIDASSPEFVAAGNFLGNGYTDVAVTVNNSVDVFLNDGSGNFSQGVGGTTGNGPSSIAVGDFNGDGKQDLAVANQADGTVSVLLSNGDAFGTFTTSATVKVGNGPSCIVVGDFNKDGKADLAVTNQTDNTVTVLLGNGDGTFSSPTTLKVGVAPTSLAVGNFNGNGNVDLAVTNSADNTVTILLSQVVGTPTPTPTPTPPGGGGGGGGGNGLARLINISTRAQVGTGGNILIPGFVVGGSGTETLLIRADGPSLTQFGVNGVLAQPSLSVYNSAGAVIASNTGWGTNTNPALIASTAASVGAFALTSGSADCALIASLPAGAYTVQVSGLNSTTGVALAEVYEVSASGTRLANISTRAQVGTGGNIIIPGFVISGSGTDQLLVRADGPSLTQFGVSGVLAQPSLSVYNGAGTVIASNTGWGTSSNPALLASTAAAVGAFAFASGSADSAQIVNLSAGAYTIQVSGVNGTTGVALAEVYEVP